MKAWTTRGSDQGFTLVELLVVIIVIGLLAGAALPLLLSQKRKAHETSAKSDVKAIAKEVAGGLISSDTSYCVAVTSGHSWARTWAADQDGQRVGDC